LSLGAMSERMSVEITTHREAPLRHRGVGLEEALGAQTFSARLGRRRDDTVRVVLGLANERST
jgi:hypothetical protein